VLANQPVVIDNGTGLLKAGFAGEEVPKLVFPSFVGRPKHHKLMDSSLQAPYYVGAKADEFRGLMKLRYPMEHGVVRDWADMEAIWSHAFQELRVPSEQHPVLLTEPPLNPRKNREKSAEVLFESMNVPALFVSLQAVLSLYASGRTTGVVLDIGDGVSHSVPIYEGFVLPNAIQRADIAGREVTMHLQLLLRKSGYRFYTSAEREVVRNIKESLCQVSIDLRKEEEAFEADRSKPSAAIYKLPDGSVIEVGSERFRAPEILFRPELIGEEFVGVHELLNNSIMRSDLDLRKTLYSSVVLSGGSTLFPGFGDRLLGELKRLAPRDTKLRITAPPERKYSTWMGGSILASLPTFRRLWVSKAEYDEEGFAVVHRKCF
jgi:centractin